MKNSMLLPLLHLFSLLLSGFAAKTPTYDHFATAECLEEPRKALYNGGMVKNSEINEGSAGWNPFGSAKVEQRQLGGNNFIVAYNRIHPYDSFSQTFDGLLKGNHYAFSAWLQVSNGSVAVRAVLHKHNVTSNEYKHVGQVLANSGCWSMLKGGFTMDASTTGRLYFEAEDTSVELWVDSIALQSFTPDQWKTHTRKHQKRSVRFSAKGPGGEPLPGAKMNITQTAMGFPFGCAINKNILTNPAYKAWFTSRGFTVTTFENEMKWYSTERVQGSEDYSDADAMLRLANDSGVTVRGHNVVWEDPSMQPGWVNSLSPEALRAAVGKRFDSIMTRYAGRVNGWDVVNELLHFNYFEQRLKDVNASGEFYRMAARYDGERTLFLNDYNTIEEPYDGKATAGEFIERVKQIKAAVGNTAQLGIGLEAHFSRKPDLAYIRTTIDMLASLNIPIWITELDFKDNLDQAGELRAVLEELHGNQHIQGIVIWGAMGREGSCYRMCLTDKNFNNLATGKVLDELMGKWGKRRIVEATADADGFFEVSLFHGDYVVTVSHPDIANYSAVTRSFKVTASPAGKGPAWRTMVVTVAP